MNIDVSVRADVLQSAVHNRVSAIPICMPQSLTGFFAGMVVDRVEIDPPVLSRATTQLPIRLADGSEAPIWAHRLRATFVVRVHVATQDALEAAGPGVPDTIPLQLEVQYDLAGELDVDDGGTVLGAGVRTTYVGKDVTLPDPGLDAQVDALLGGAGQFAPIDLSALTEALDVGAGIRNIGLALGQDRMVVRIEVGSVAPSPQAAWTSFFSGPPNWLADRDWAIFVDEALICQAVEQRLGAELAKSEEGGTIEVLEQPTAIWLGWMGVPLIQVQAYIDVVEACPNGLDIGVEIYADTILSLAPGPEFRLSTTIEWNLIDSDVLLCGITMGLFAATLGAVLGGGAGPVGAGIGAIIGMVGSIVAIAAIADTVSPPPMEAPDCQQTEADDDHVKLVCTQPLELASNQLLGDLVPDQLTANAQGLMLRGTSDVQTLNTGLFVGVQQFAWQSKLNCNTKNVDVTLAGGATFASGEPAPLLTCGVEVLDDPLGYFIASLQMEYLQKWTLDIDVDWSKSAAYLADPYPCRVLVRTSRGTRLVNLGPVPPAPAPPGQDELIKAIATYCLKALDPKARIHALWRLWLPNPPPEKWLSRHRWDVAMAGADPGAGLRLVDGAGNQLAEQVAGPGGAARLQLVRQPGSVAEHNGLNVQVELPEGVAGAVMSTTRQLPVLSIGQTQLVRARVLPLPGPAQAMVRVRRARPLLAVVSDEWLVTFGRQPVAGLAATAQLRLPGLGGVIDDAGGLVAFGECGLVRFSVAADGSLEFAGRWRLEEGLAAAPVRDAHVVGEVTGMLADGRLTLLRPGWRPRVLDAPPDAVLADWGGLLGVFSPRAGRVDLYDVRRELPAAPYTTVAVPAGAAPVDVGRRRVRPVGQTVFSLHAGEKGWSAPEARLRPPGWYDTAVSLGPWLARVESDGRVEVWRAGRPVEAKALLRR